MQLRPYQADAVGAVCAEWAVGRRKTLLVLPTGCGKTVVFSEIVGRRVRLGGRALILAHREELLTQAADKLYRVSGIHAAMEKADMTCIGDPSPVCVGSVQTLCREARLERFPRDYFSTLVVDEAHHCMSDSYRRVLDHFIGAFVLGVTATPDRGDRKDLASVFDSTAFEYPLRKAVEEGYLSRVVSKMIPLGIDLKGVRVSGGDLEAGSLGNALEPYLGQIADIMAVECRGRKTVVFLPLVSLSQRFRDLLLERGMRAAEVNGESPDRAQVLAGFEAGRFDVLCNAMLLTEGWDCPSVDCIVVLRPTKVRALYQQMVGRGMRTSPGKRDLLLLDFLWMTERHDLCHPASLVARTAAIASKMGDGDLLEQEEQAQRDVQAEREEALRRELAEMRRKKARLVDPIQFAFSIEDEDLASYEPTHMWEMEPPTERQVAAIERYGLSSASVGNKGQATILLDRIARRRNAGLSTPKQIRLLEQRGFVHVGTWTMAQASAIIGRLVQNKWRMPGDLNPPSYVPPRPRRVVAQPRDNWDWLDKERA